MKITSAEYLKGGTNLSHFPTDDFKEIMFCGRSNVGKSSFINSLVNKTIARTSSNPGKTQTINFFTINEAFYLVDVPGYGYANVSKGQKEAFGRMIEEYITKREQLKAIFLLVDFRHDPTKDDVLMYDFLKYYEKEVYVIATKKDKVNASSFYKNKKAILKTLNIDEAHLFITSSEKKEGILEVTNKIEEILAR